MVALSGHLLILPIAAGLLTRWFTPAVICSTGLLIAVAGLFWLSQMPIGTPAPILVWPLLLIGVGISLPWGLMDGLAVSVVPKERAGMATGIFSTTRVAGEGVALAIVTAVLSSLAKSHLADGTDINATVAAQRLVTGDLAGAIQLILAFTPFAMMQRYSDAFSTLLLFLTVVTLLTAVVVMFSLRGHSDDQEHSGDQDNEALGVDIEPLSV